MRFTRSLSAEFKKIFATPTWWIIALVTFAYAGFMAATFAVMFVFMQDQMQAQPAGAATSLDTQMMTNTIYASVSSFVYALPFLFGAMVATSELRHKTLALTFLAEPKREIVFGAKTVVIAVLGVLIAVAGLLGSVGAGALVTSLTGGDTNLAKAQTYTLFLRIIAALTIWAVIGFGLGLVLRSQAIAIVVALVFTQFLEPLLRTGAMFWEPGGKIARFLPGAATDSFVGAGVLNDLSTIDPQAGGVAVTALENWQAALVLLTYALVLLVAGYLLRWRRDIQ